MYFLLNKNHIVLWKVVYSINEILLQYYAFILLMLYNLYLNYRYVKKNSNTKAFGLRRFGLLRLFNRCFPLQTVFARRMTTLTVLCSHFLVRRLRGVCREWRGLVRKWRRVVALLYVRTMYITYSRPIV